MSSKGAKAVTSLSKNFKSEVEGINSCEESDQDVPLAHKIDTFELFVHENLDHSGVVLIENEEKLVQEAMKIDTQKERTKYSSVGDVESCEVSDEEAASEGEMDEFESFYYEEDEFEDFESFVLENLDQSGFDLAEDEEKDFESFVRENLDQSGFDLTEDEEKDFESFVCENLDQSGFHLTENEEKDFESFVHENLEQSGFDLTEDEEKLIQEQIDYTLNFSEI